MQRDFANALVESAPVIILLLDEDGRIQYANPYFEQLTGYSLEKVAGKDWFTTFLPERDHDEIQRLFGGAVQGTPTRGKVNAILTRRGEERLIEWHDRLLTGQDGHPSWLLAIGQDVTDRLHAEAAGAQRNRLLDESTDEIYVFRQGD